MATAALVVLAPNPTRAALSSVMLNPVPCVLQAARVINVEVAVDLEQGSISVLHHTETVFQGTVVVEEGFGDDHTDPMQHVLLGIPSAQHHTTCVASVVHLPVAQDMTVHPGVVEGALQLQHPLQAKTLTYIDCAMLMQSKGAVDTLKACPGAACVWQNGQLCGMESQDVLAREDTTAAAQTMQETPARGSFAAALTSTAPTQANPRAAARVAALQNMPPAERTTLLNGQV